MKGSRITIYLYDKEYKETKKLLKKHGVSFSEFIRSQMTQLLACEGKGFLVAVPEKRTTAPDGLPLDTSKTEPVSLINPQELDLTQIEPTEKEGHQTDTSYLEIFSSDDLYE